MSIDKRLLNKISHREWMFLVVGFIAGVLWKLILILIAIGLIIFFVWRYTRKDERKSKKN